MADLRAGIKRRVPPVIYESSSFAARRWQSRRRGRNHPTRMDAWFVAKYGTTVRKGPMTGLIYDRRVLDTTTAVASKLLGAYEHELHGAIEQILASPMTRFVDIGSAEGYYAVGVAKARPDVQVQTFDIDATARFMTRLTKRANAVENVEIGEGVTDAVLTSCDSRTVVLSDCEGAEAILLDPMRHRGLQEATLLVEVHDFIDPSISSTLRHRFFSSHEIVEIPTSDEALLHPELDGLGEADRAALLSEGRPAAMCWFLMTPRQTARAEGRTEQH